MKRIEAIIQPHRLTKVTHALHELPRFPGMTVCEAQGQSRARGGDDHEALDEDCLSFVQKKLIVMYCEDDEASAIAALIAIAAHTGKPGDGMVFISDVVDVLGIREAGGTGA